MRVLAKGKKLRGTVFDPFGYAHVRRLERALIDHYESMVLDAADHLTEQNYDAATQAAVAADIVRGYEDVKLGNVDRYRARLTELSIDTTALPTTR